VCFLPLFRSSSLPRFCSSFSSPSHPLTLLPSYLLLFSALLLFLASALPFPHLLTFLPSQLLFLPLFLLRGPSRSSRLKFFCGKKFSPSCIFDSNMVFIVLKTWNFLMKRTPDIFVTKVERVVLESVSPQGRKLIGE